MPTSTVFPKVTTSLEFNQFPSALTDGMRAMIVGSQSLLTRYAAAAEKPLGLLGAYDPLLPHSYPYPSRVASAIVDQAYTKLWADNALLKYLDKPVGVQGTFAPVANYSNRLRASAISFKANGTTYPRSVVFGDRDCQAGDVVDLRLITGGVEYDKRTTIAGFVAEQIAANVAAAVAAASDAGTQSASATAAKSAGANNQVTAAASAAAYDGTLTGNVNETYTVEVTTGSVGGDLTRARLKVISASGNDNYNPANADGTTGVKVSAVTVATVLTPRGATVTFTLNGAATTDSGVTTNDLIVGQKWTVVVHELWTAPVATSGGAYTGAAITTYVVTVLTGGLYASVSGAQGGPGAGLIGPQYTPGYPTILVTTTTGVDASGPTAVTGAGVAVPVGTQGVTISFSGLGLNRGDTYLIAVTPVTSGAYQTIILQDNLVDAALPATDAAVKLYIRKQGVPVAKNRVSAAPLTNWSQDGTYFTTQAGALAYDPTYTVAGVQQPLPLAEGTLYVETKQWLQDKANTIGVITSDADITGTIGVIDRDNRLAWGLHLAGLNSAGSPVYYGVVGGDPTLESSWKAFLDVIANVTGFYNIAPMTTIASVMADYKAHADAQSAPEVGATRAVWLPLTSKSIRPVVTSATTTDLATAMATITADPVTGLLTRLRVPAGDAKFVSVNPVLPGDLVYAAFTTDGFGNPAYTQYAVAAVVNEDTLTLATPVPTAVTTAAKIEVWHPMSQNDITNDLLAQAAALKSQNVRAVWPDKADNYPGCYVAAALAGSASGVCIHQGLRNLEVIGLTTLQSQSQSLSVANLNKLAAGGVWVVTADPTGAVYSLSAVTTDQTSLLTGQEVIVRNAAAQAIFMQVGIAKLIGVSNVTDGTLSAVRATLQASMGTLKTATTNTMRLGPALLSGTIVDVSPHAILKDRIVATLQLSLPYPFGKLVLTIQLVA